MIVVRTLDRRLVPVVAIAATVARSVVVGDIVTAYIIHGRVLDGEVGCIIEEAHGEQCALESGEQRGRRFLELLVLLVDL